MHKNPLASRLPVVLSLILLVVQIAPLTSAAPRFNLRGPNASSVEKVYLVSQSKVILGKEYEVLVTSPDCAADSEELKDAELYAPVGSGITVIETTKTADCSLVAKISVAPDAQVDKVLLWVRKTDGNVVLGTVEFTIIRLPPGPIPPGLTPQVDIMWSVIPDKIVGHNFGRTVQNNYYCIEVVVGNNTGYSLQIVSIGFEVPLTDEDLLNEALARVPAAPVIPPRASSPKSGSTGSVPPGTRPTPTPAPAPAVAHSARFLKIPNSSYRLTRGSLESRHLLYPRSFVLNAITALGPIFTGFTPFFHNLNHRGNYTEFINIFSNPLEKGLEMAWPDQREAQRNRFDDQILRDGLIISNNISTRSMVFFPKNLLKPYLDVAAVEGLCQRRLPGNADLSSCRQTITKEFERTYASWKNNPRAVIDKLGKLILIGDVIAATNRITVTSGPVPGPLAAPPTLLDAKFDKNVLDEVPQAEDGVLEIIGSHLTGAHITSTSDKIKVTNVTTDSAGGMIAAKMAVAPDAEPGDYNLIISTSAGSAPVRFRVVHKEKPKDLAIKYEGDEGLVAAAPELEAHVRGEVEIVIEGKNLKDATLRIEKPAAGNLGIRVVESDDTQIRAVVTVSPETTAKDDYKITVTNSSGESETVDFKVKYAE